MTVLLWILAALATPFVLFVAWLGWVFLKEFFSAKAEYESAEESSRIDDEAAEAAAVAERLGLLPLERQNTELAAPLPAEWAAALASVGRGEWQQAAQVMHGIGRDWERRSAFTALLGDKAAEADEWLLSWEDARPDDPDAAVVRASSTVTLAWKLRGAKRAEYTTHEQFEGFRRTLEGAAPEDVARAAALNPDDPTPYVKEIWIALGLGRPNAEMDTLWAKLTELAPHHYEAHFSALQYWCAKWRGSERLATSFAERAAAGAPAGSLLTVLPLIAHLEHDESDDTAAENTPEMIARVNTVLADVTAADPAHPRLPEVRHLLAYFLRLQGRNKEALEQFRLVDGYVEALPWRYRVNPAAEYCAFRNATAKAAEEVAAEVAAQA
ncbi:hypothetical protein [Streptomyces sp. NPDC026659]|uniref:hypothetical protein n=1 Tax=Streptomyces sp. NPDC026659 TaxID=3155123 RepID=UPI0033FBC78F